jgi:tight adherence protein B
VTIVVISFAVLVASLLVVELAHYIYMRLRYPDYKDIERRLRGLPKPQDPNESVEIARRKVLSSIPFLNQILWHVPGIQRLDALREKAHTLYPIGVHVLFSMVLGMTGYLGCSLLKTEGYAVPAIGTVLLAGVPFGYLLFKKNRRTAKFERQFPEGLELLALALRAGHTFASGVRLVADEFDDPLGTEFERTLEEINAGVDETSALKDLAARMDVAELKYFVVGLIIQREVGGNIAELMQNLGHILRERFKLEGKIRSVSAEGRLSAVVLIAMPFFIVAMLLLLNRDYMMVLFESGGGRLLIGAATGMMALGAFVITRVTKIKV